MAEIITAIKKWFGKGQPKDEAPEGLCPNCWGQQEYGGQFYEAIKNEGVDVNTMSEKIGWVQDYADKHLRGIRLKPSDDALVCDSCKVVYREE